MRAENMYQLRCNAIMQYGMRWAVGEQQPNGKMKYLGRRSFMAVLNWCNTRNSWTPGVRVAVNDYLAGRS